MTAAEGPCQMKKIVLSLILLVTSIQSLAGGMYSWEWIKEEPFRSTYLGFVEGRELPEWVITLDGPSTKSRVINAGDTAYNVIGTCKPHDCGDKNLTVFYDPAGIIYMLFNGEKTFFIGNPEQSIIDLMVNEHASRHKYSDVRNRLKTTGADQQNEKTGTHLDW